MFVILLLKGLKSIRVFWLPCVGFVRLAKWIYVSSAALASCFLVLLPNPLA